MSSFHNVLAALITGTLLPLAAASPLMATQTTLSQAAEPNAAQDELLSMATQAGVIFAGEVIRITPHPSFTPGSGWVEIAFRVDQSIRGCEGQSTYTLREWAGLWTGGHQRYTPGQRLLVLLHAPSASGLSSPVGGQDGIIPITGAGTAPRPNDTLVAQAEPAVDLRWIQARIPRAIALPQNSRLHSLATNPSHSGHDQAPLAVRRLTSSTFSNLTPSAARSTDTLPLASTTSRGVSLRSILAILGAWQAQQSDATH